MYHRHCLSSNQWGLSWSIHKICGNYPTNQSIQSLLFNLRTSLLSAEWRLRKGCWSFAQAGWHQTYGVEDGDCHYHPQSEQQQIAQIAQIGDKIGDNDANRNTQWLTSLNGWLGFSGKSISVFYLSIYNQSTLPNMKITPQKWFSTGWAPPSYKLVYKPV